MPPLKHEQFDSAKSLQIYSKLTQIALGTIVPPSYNFHAIRRLLRIDDDDVTPASDDPLASALIKAASSMKHTERSGQVEVDVEPLISLATLFDSASPTAKGLHPKLYLAYDLRKASVPICGLTSVCDFTRDDSLGTERFSQAFCRDHDLPRFGSDWLLIDIVASKKHGTGALLILQVYMLACRARDKAGVCAVAVTKSGKKLFADLGFESFSFRDDGLSKSFMYARANSLTLTKMIQRLSFPGDKVMLEDLCFRFGLTEKSSDRVMGRC